MLYMPYEKNDLNVDDYSDHLLIVERLIMNNPDSHVVIGDFMVDFSRIRVHTALLRSFCDDLGLYTAVEHHNSLVDYAYHLKF
jgi:hypothetical protein